MAFSEALKLKVKRQAYFQCALCKSLGVEIHHIVPQAEGGDDSEENAAPLCPSCHESYGANPTKRKFIREARDFWYEICEKRFAGDPDHLERLSDMLLSVVTKDDLSSAVDEVKGLLDAVVQSGGRAGMEGRTEQLAQLAGAMQVSANRHCTSCGTTIGLLIGDRGKCPSCGAPW